jgi:hypothetical protein
MGPTGAAKGFSVLKACASDPGGICPGSAATRAPQRALMTPTATIRPANRHPSTLHPRNTSKSRPGTFDSTRTRRSSSPPTLPPRTRPLPACCRTKSGKVTDFTRTFDGMTTETLLSMPSFSARSKPTLLFEPSRKKSA